MQSGEQKLNDNASSGEQTAISLAKVRPHRPMLAHCLRDFARNRTVTSVNGLVQLPVPVRFVSSLFPRRLFARFQAVTYDRLL
jgi:hypothetical protein